MLPPSTSQNHLKTAYLVYMLQVTSLVRTIEKFTFQNMLLKFDSYSANLLSCLQVFLKNRTVTIFLKADQKNIERKLFKFQQIFTTEIY